MRFELLGSLRVSGEKGDFTLSAPKIELLLATLLVSHGRVVSKEQLLMELWGEHPPRQAPTALHVYISQLRKLLATAGARADIIITRSPGYHLKVQDGELDLNDFQSLSARGRTHLAAHRYEETITDLESALSLYRAPVLEGMGEGPILSGVATWAEEERLACQELSINAHIALGRHREVTGLLASLTTRYPLREEFYGQLMLALYRGERQVEALQVYQTARASLRAELDLEPSAALRKLHHAILASDRQLQLPAAS